MKRKYLYSYLEECLGETICPIVINNTELNDGSQFSGVSESIQLHFRSKSAIEFSATDIPHFYGEGDLLVEETRLRQSLIANSFSLKVNNIRVWGYKPKGFNIFPQKNLVQIEFVENEKKRVSIGFFLIAGSVEFISTEQLALNVGKTLRANYNCRLFLLKEITVRCHSAD